MIDIIEGWLKKFRIIKSDELLSKERLIICDACPSAKTSKLIKIINGDVLRTDTLMCTECHCPCLEKSLVTQNKCPLKKWKR